MTKSTSVRATPPPCDDTLDGDPSLTPLTQRILDAIEEAAATDGRDERVSRVLSDYVVRLRFNGAGPETMLICVKQLLQRSDLARMPFSAAETLQREWISRSIRAYYGAEGPGTQ